MEKHEHSTRTNFENAQGGDGEQLRAAEFVKAALRDVAPEARFERVEVVSPKVSGAISDAGILSVILASLAMFIYIWIRFDWLLAVGAIITLVFDVATTMGSSVAATSTVFLAAPILLVLDETRSRRLPVESKAA